MEFNCFARKKLQKSIKHIFLQKLQPKIAVIYYRKFLFLFSSFTSPYMIYCVCLQVRDIDADLNVTLAFIEKYQAITVSVGL